MSTTSASHSQPSATPMSSASQSSQCHGPIEADSLLSFIGGLGLSVEDSAALIVSLNDEGFESVDDLYMSESEDGA